MQAHPNPVPLEEPDSSSSLSAQTASLPKHPVIRHQTIRPMNIYNGLLALMVLIDQFRLVLWNDPRFTRWNAILIPALVFGNLVLLGLLARKAPPLTRQAKPILLWGAGFIILTALADVGITLYHSPNLLMEGNPYIWVLVEADWSLPTIYCVFAFAQCSFVSVLIAALYTFLRHWTLLTENVRQSQAITFSDWIKAATGGEGLTFREWLFPLRPREFPNFYHYFWPVTFTVLVGACLIRCYAFLEWTGLVPLSLVNRILFFGLAFVMAFVGYFYLLYQATHPHSNHLDENGPQTLVS